MKTTQLQKTNEEMYNDAVKHFESMARATGEFEYENMESFGLPKLFYGCDKEQSLETLSQIFDLEDRTVVDLLNLQDYSRCKMIELDYADNEQRTGFSKNFLLECLYDVLAWLIDGIIKKKDPVAFDMILKKYV